MPKKKNTKSTSRKASSTSRVHSADDHSFLIILGGGFIIIVCVLAFLSNQTSSSRQVVTKLTTQVMAQEGQVIAINNFDYSPKTITVKAGTAVTWLNSDTVDHSVVADDDSFDTGVLKSGEKGSYTFTRPGTYAFHCETHPSMTGTVVVE